MHYTDTTLTDQVAAVHCSGITETALTTSDSLQETLLTVLLSRGTLYVCTVITGRLLTLFIITGKLRSDVRCQDKKC